MNVARTLDRDHELSSPRLRMNTCRIVALLPGVLRGVGGRNVMETRHRRCCGIDVHKKRLMVHVLPAQGEAAGKAVEREFGTFTRDLRSLRDWLKAYDV